MAIDTLTLEDRQDVNQLTEFWSRAYLTKGDLAGGRVAEQLQSWNGNPEALSSIRALNASWICSR